jgi:hypothetical protein
MEAGQLLRRPAKSCLSSTTLSALSQALQVASRRHKSTASRMKRALNIAPHVSFLPDSSPRDHIIYNPPSAAPTVYHTPFKFLPKNDPRRRANISVLFASHPSSSPTSTEVASTQPASSADSADLLPVLPNTPSPSFKPQRNVSLEEVEEMRRLRAEDPVTNTVVALAQRFNCSRVFVMMCCQSSRDHQERMRDRLTLIQGRWGPTRTAARDDRRRRKEMLLRGEL